MEGGKRLWEGEVSTPVVSRESPPTERIDVCIPAIEIAG